MCFLTFFEKIFSNPKPFLEIEIQKNPTVTKGDQASAKGAKGGKARRNSDTIQIWILSDFFWKLFRNSVWVLIEVVSKIESINQKT